MKLKTTWTWGRKLYMNLNHKNSPAFCSFISWHYSGEPLQTPQNLTSRIQECWLSKRKTWAWKAEGTTYLCTEMIPLAFNSFILRPRCHRPTPLISWTLQTPQLLQYLGCFEKLNLIISWPQEELFHFSFGQISKSSSPKGWEVADT